MIRKAKLPKDARHLLYVAQKITAVAYPHRKYDSHRAYALMQAGISSADHCVLIREKDDIPCGTIGGLTLELDVYSGHFVLIKILQSDTPHGLVLLIKELIAWTSKRKKVREIAFIRDFRVTDKQSKLLHWAFAKCGFEMIGGTYQLRL